MSKVAQMVTDKIIALLESGVAPWAQPWKSNMIPMRYIGKPYRGVNFLMLMDSPFPTPIWLSYKMAQQLGGNVKAGAAGTKIVYYKMMQATSSHDPKPENEKYGKRPLLLYSTVFNLEQTDDVPLPEWYDPEAPVQFNPIEAADAVIKNMPLPPTINHGGSKASYNPKSDTVSMPTPESFDTAPHYYSVAFHELAHSTGHKKRLDRELTTTRNDQYAREELVAELTASFLCAKTGIDNNTVDKTTAAYLRSWIEVLQGNSNLITSAAGAAQKATDYITNFQYEAEAEKETT